jgi:hypothetical protein
MLNIEDGMPEQEEDINDALYDSIRNHLKDVNLRALEKAIAKAVGQLVGVELTCNISKIDYSPKHLSRTCADFTVSLSEPFRGFDFGAENGGRRKTNV